MRFQRTTQRFNCFIENSSQLLRAAAADGAQTNQRRDPLRGTRDFCDQPRNADLPAGIEDLREIEWQAFIASVADRANRECGDSALLCSFKIKKLSMSTASAAPAHPLLVFRGRDYVRRRTQRADSARAGIFGELQDSRIA